MSTKRAPTEILFDLRVQMIFHHGGFPVAPDTRSSSHARHKKPMSLSKAVANGLTEVVGLKKPALKMSMCSNTDRSVSIATPQSWLCRELSLMEFLLISKSIHKKQLKAAADSQERGMFS